jgi:DNA-binding response OmpR family regulator
MSEAVKRVLLVDDDIHLTELLRVCLQGEGHAVAHAGDGRQGLALVEDGGWDAIILDPMLPGVDGLEICRRVREQARYTPVVITSAHGSELQRILGPEMGADDYLAKPISVPELLARLKALWRRVDAIAGSLRTDGHTIEAGGLHIDRLTRIARLNGAAVELTPREFDLLQHFAQHPQQVFSRIELLNRVWGVRHGGYEHTVNTHINRLRGKVEADPRKPERIVTVWGLGYKFCIPDSGPHPTR